MTKRNILQNIIHTQIQNIINKFNDSVAKDFLGHCFNFEKNASDNIDETLNHEFVCDYMIVDEMCMLQKQFTEASIAKLYAKAYLEFANINNAHNIETMDIVIAN